MHRTRPAAPAARTSALLASVWSAAVTLAVTHPLFSPGYLLHRDAVSTPRSYLTDAALGVGDAAPRAVPQDAVIALASSVVDGGLLVRALTVLALWCAGVGAARIARRLLPSAGTGGMIAAATFAVWNPYVVERLLLGHWSLMAGYGALFWVVSAAVDLRAGRRGAWPRMALALAAAGLTPTGAVLAALTAVAWLTPGLLTPGLLTPGLLTPGSRRRGAARGVGVAALAAAVATPWLLVSGGSGVSDPAGVAAFAARPEGTGLAGALLGLGGAWNAEVIPAAREGAWAWAALAATLTVLALGANGLWRRRRALAPGLLLAAGSLALVFVAATPAGQVAVRSLIETVPGAGLVRDGQKWVALAAPAYALSAASAVAALTRFLRPAGAAVAVTLAIVAAVPLAPRDVEPLRPVPFPAGFATVADIVAADPGDVAVLPAGQFREFPGIGVVLDPAPRALPADVLVAGDLVVSGGTVAGEGARAARVEGLLLAGATPHEIAAEGVTWVLVETRSRGPLGDSARTLDAAREVHRDDDLVLYRIDGAVDLPRPDRTAAIAGHLVWAGVLILGAVGSAASAATDVRRRGRPPTGRPR